MAFRSADDSYVGWIETSIGLHSFSVNYTNVTGSGVTIDLESLQVDSELSDIFSLVTSDLHD